MWRDHRYELPSSSDDPMETVVSCVLIFAMGVGIVLAAQALDWVIEWLTR